MWRCLAVLAIAAIAVVLLGGCGEETTTGGTDEALEATEAAPLVIVADSRYKSFQVGRSDIILIRLGENPTTGYQWEFASSDESVVVLEASEYAAEAQGLVGSGGMRTFTARAQGPGTATMELKLRRNWEAEDAAIARFAVTIQVVGD